ADGQVIETDSFDGQRTGIVYEQDDPESPFAALRRPLPFRITDADGRTEELRYDAFGRVVRARSLLPSGQAVATTETSYHNEGPLFGTIAETKLTGTDPVTSEAVTEVSTTRLVGLEEGYYHVQDRQSGVQG